MELILNQKKLMAKNLEEKFNLYCNSENLEVNQNQVLVIKFNYYKMNFRSFISDLFSKENLKKVFIFMETLELENYDYEFLL